MRRMVRALIIGLAVAVAGPALAHESGKHARGTVKEISATRLVVTTADGHDAAFAVNAETRFRRGDSPAGREDVRVGERAVVHGTQAGDGVAATDVRLSPVKK